MITEQERIIRKSQGYDIGFEQSGKKYWINSNEWNEEKEKRLFQETGLKTFREHYRTRNLVIYDPKYFENKESHLGYIGSLEQDIPQPINMSSGRKMFSRCSLREINLSDWDVQNVIDVKGMFLSCHILQCVNLGNWNTVSLSDASYMFKGCQSLKSVNLANWDTHNLKYMDAMFRSCAKLQSLNLANWKLNDEIFIIDMFEWCNTLLNKNECKTTAELLQKIIEDSNKHNLGQLKAF